MIRYIGQTMHPRARLAIYEQVARTPGRTTNNRHLDNWLRSVHRDGMLHEVEILESGFSSRDELNEAEAFWEDYWRAMGSPLINIRKCGGNRGALSSETKARLSTALRGRKHSERSNQLRSARFSGEGNPMHGKIPWNKGLPRDQETREKISRALTGRPGHQASEQTRKRMSDAKRAWWAARKAQTKAE